MGLLRPKSTIVTNTDGSIIVLCGGFVNRLFLDLFGIILALGLMATEQCAQPTMGFLPCGGEDALEAFASSAVRTLMHVAEFIRQELLLEGNLLLQLQQLGLHPGKLNDLLFQFPVGLVLGDGRQIDNGLGSVDVSDGHGELLVEQRGEADIFDRLAIDVHDVEPQQLLDAVVGLHAVEVPVAHYYPAVVDDDGAGPATLSVLRELVAIKCNISVAARLGRFQNV